MTFKEVIYDIRESLNSYNIDSEITDRYIAFSIRNARSLVLRQHMANNPGEYRNQLTQTVYMDVEQVSYSQYPAMIPLDTYLLATTQVLPNIVGEQMYKEIEVRSVERLGSEIEMLDKIRAVQFKYAPNGFIYGWRENDGKLYFVSTNLQYLNLKQVVVTAIFEDPEAAYLLNDGNGEIEEYPITANLWINVKEMVIQQLLRKFGIPTDKLNNENEDRDGSVAQK